MKRFIPAPIKETLKFRAETKADSKSSTSSSRTSWDESFKRQIKIKAGDQRTNHPRSTAEDPNE